MSFRRRHRAGARTMAQAIGKRSGPVLPSELSCLPKHPRPGSPPKRYRNKQYDLQYDFLGGRDEPL